jgi:hypothetical protein
MQGFTKCSNNHFYKEDLASCPYCPGQSASGGAKTTTGLGHTSYPEANDVNNAPGDMDKTRVGGAASSAGQSTTKSGQPTLEQMNFDRTFISIPTEGSDEDKKVVSRPTRRIVGWLISYTIDPMGVDFRIFEGNNTLGRGTDNSIVIPQDSTISSHHATILYRDSQGFFVKDEMSANGTFINGLELEISKAYPLKDGDLLRIAKTEFRFKSAL